MKKLVLISVLILTLVATTTVLAANLSKASGQGRLNQARHFSFHAQELRDGTVDGSGVLTIPVQGEPENVQIHFDIDCMNTDGNTAIMSGTITKSTVWEEGWAVWFKVVDNGEGAKASGPDMMTYLYGEPSELGLTCDADLTELYPGVVVLEEVLSGNIQVK